MPVPQNKLLTLLFMVRLCAISKASVGDRSYIYNKCLNKCFAVNCTDTETFIAKQSFVLRLLRWSCPEECRYLCMWETVDAFRQDGTPVPQFHGKVVKTDNIILQCIQVAVFSVFVGFIAIHP